MKKLNLFAGIAVAISGLFASQTFAASGCVSAACDPAAAAAAACDPAAAAAADPTSAADPNSGCLSATCAASPTCDPAAAAACNSGCLSGCNSGCNSGMPGCGMPGCGACGANGACSACGSPSCNGCAPYGCGIGLCNLRQALCKNVCWSGFMNGGYFTNFKGDRSNGYTDCWSNNIPTFNTLYISGVKKAFTGGCGFDYGFGIDFAFGEDTRLFRAARGWDENWYTGHMYNPDSEAYDIASYGFAMPQLYMEMAINNWTVKAGHFYGLLGYEGATANSRFFYTKGLLCSVSPVAQTGALVSYNGFQNLDMTLGWVNGWNNGFDNSEYGEGMVTGAFTYHMNQYASLKYAFMAGTTDLTGPFGFLGPYVTDYEGQSGDASAHSVVLDLQLTACLEAVSLLYYGDFNGDTILVMGQHLYQDLNCCTKFGFRAEWLKYTVGEDATELTTFGIGLNYHPCGNKNLVFRPEIRYDKVWGAKADTMLNGRVDQITMGFDLMLTF